LAPFCTVVIAAFAPSCTLARISRASTSLRRARFSSSCASLTTFCVAGDGGGLDAAIHVRLFVTGLLDARRMSFFSSSRLRCCGRCGRPGRSRSRVGEAGELHHAFVRVDLDVQRLHDRILDELAFTWW
jgi:hypothetical protein